MQMSELRLTVPAQPESLHVLRVVVTGVGARLDWSFDSLDEFSLAVDEASARLVAGAPALVLELVIRPGDDAVEVVISSDADGRDWPPEGHQSTLNWQVLNALVDEVAFDRFDDRPGIRLLKRVARRESGS